MDRNIPISRPIYNVEPYDFIIETNGKFVSVQVKKSWVDKKGRNVVSIKSSYPRSSKTKFVNKESVDYLAVLVNYWDWYIIPCIAFEGKTSSICVGKKVHTPNILIIGILSEVQILVHANGLTAGKDRHFRNVAQG